MSASNIQVAIKVRPIELNQACKWEVAGNSIKLVDGGGPEPFYFDHIFDQDANNQVIFDTIAKQIVAAGVKGFNGTIFAYGQTSSGKTYTMMGDEKNPGVMVLAAKKIFKEIENSTDWQFLLRVSYIEIYNEKIHDLLNKSNTDLKIHETSNGEVAVNCSENIITCEQDLLIHLREGSKQRKIGETHMNERSSRSHAIFRIIIESRKIDQTDEDSVQISILNLVDLAGSERADQTGATGSRLKEGGHINKSLLFLSRVIKQLAEAKYVSYRDSKLTRILQASLGGNALTAIICTINPTAVEETLSTLSFANRAKVVRNKPQVNEVVSDSAMMKRLVKKIDALTTELEVEKTKNSQIKVTQLQKLLNDEIHKIINSNSLCSLKASNRNRRRTWCPSSMIPTLAEEGPQKPETCIPQLPFSSQAPTKLQLPKSGFNFTPHITVRDVYYQEKLKEIECSPSIDEEFIPGEDVCFDDALTPQTSPTKLGFKTPTNSDFKLRASLTPKLTEKQSLLKVEQELKELETFTNLENKLNVEHDTYNTLKYKLENAERIIAGYEKERESFAFIKVEHLEAQTNLANCQKRCQELESKVKDLEESSERNINRIDRYEKEVTDLNDKINKLEMENRAAVGLDIEFQQHKNKSKRRENELLEALEEKRKEISKLERSLQTVTNDMLNNSKEEIQQISRSLNETESTCTNCKDFQRILSSKQQLIEDFEKANLDNQTLHLSIEKISAEAESAKLRADYLETENSSLKKDIENLTTLHGTLESIQEQIGCLQVEKCKLESVKIEFEVMSKETANKIAEKINITQEIQTLNTQRDSLAAECDKLQAEIASTTCTREELDKIRTENNSLNLELQKIKTKLEATEQDHVQLMAENQSKSDSFEKLNMEVIAARNQLQGLQSEYLDIQQKYEQIQAECNKHEGTIGEIQSEYDSIQNKYQCLQKEYEKLENDSVQSIADCDRVQSQNENLETEIRELKTKVEEAQRKLLENDSLQLELESLKSEMNRLQGEYEKNVSTNKENEEVFELKAMNSQLREELSSLQLRFEEMQKEYDDISTQLVDNFSDYETLQAEMESLQAEFDRYKNAAVVDDIEAMKQKSKKLEADNNELLRQNAEWKNTVMSMTKSMGEKCDESDHLIVQLEEVKNESMQSDSPRKSLDDCLQFIQLANSFLEVEIALGNGGTRIFQAVGFNKCSNGTRLIIGNVSDITQGAFRQLRGAIEFAISSEVHKLSNDIFDSLEMEKNTTSPNSCDSLEEGPSDRQPNEAHFNELIEEKSKLFESVRELQETVSMLKLGTIELANTRQELEDTQFIVEQLKSEKSNLSAICEENKCKISELSEIVSRAESENMKLIADCEELKKTVESEGTLDNVSRECYEELKRQYDEICLTVQDNDCFNCIELREQISTLKANEATENNTNFKESKCTSCEEYQSKISKLEAFVGEEQTNGNHDKESELSAKETTNEHVGMNGELNEVEEHIQGNGSMADDDKSVKYEKEISNLMEELKTEKSKYQEVQNQINDLRKKFEEENQESAKQFEDLNLRFTKLQMEYDELLSFERMKSTELEESAVSLEKLSKECNLLQETVAGLKESVTLVEDERNNILQEKKKLEEINTDLGVKLQTLKEDSIVSLNEKNMAMEKCSVLEKEKGEIVEDCQTLKADIEKLIEEHKNNVKEQESDELQRLKTELEQNVSEKSILEEKLNKLSDDLIRVSAEKHHLQSEFEELKEQQENLKEKHSEEREILRGKTNSLSKQINELTDDKKDLELALEKANKHAEFLLQQGKNIEDQLSLDLSKANNSNTSMLEEIKELKEKLETTENNLKVALEQINCEKDQIKVELTSSNNSLLEKIAKLETACTLLTQELADSKESLLTEVSLKHAQESECKSKDDLLAQLSNTNDSLSLKCSELEEKCMDLEKQIKEKEQTLSDDKHHLQLSQKECSLKDDVISQLSNKNETLVTKITHLQEKITTLEQEFEKSKRDLSEDVQLKIDESSKKDNLIEELSIKNSSLATKSSELEDKLSLLKKHFNENIQESLTKDELITELSMENSSLATKSLEQQDKLSMLEKQLEESKRCLTTEINLKEVLQMAKIKESSTKDELITELTIENGSLAKKSSDLEDKLSHLEKQLEESKCLLEEEIRLKIGESSKKDELIAELSMENSSLSTKSSELEDQLSLLEKQFAESKSDLSEDVRLKKEESLKKDELITQLTIDNGSLSTKSSDLEDKLSLLEKQFEESKRSLATEIHLKEVLEKANTERDDLIVQLTNNNNSLVTKSTELEEKLAILGNQFEESKRHLSTEIDRLNKILADTNAASNAQSTKIDDLMEKLKSFESEIHIAQKTTLERDSLLQKIDQFQKEYNSLALKHANLELTKSTFEAELNSARSVVVENTNLIKKVNELQSSLNEIHLKCDSLKSSNTELELANKKLTDELRDAIQQAEECNRLRSEILKLREEVGNEKELKNKFNDELQNSLKEWESKELQFSKQISQLQAAISSLALEKSNIQKEFEDTFKKSSDKIAELEQHIQSLQKDQSMNMSKSSNSPRKEKGMEHWMSENHQLKIKNMSLMDKLDSNQKSSPNEERKNRRLSTHDERRMNSFWDSNRDVSTMTDPTNTECSCSEMNVKLNELKQTLLIRDSQVNTLSMELKNHPLKTEYATLKQLFAKEESKQQELRKEIKKYKSLIVNRTNESRHCAKCAELEKKMFVDSFSQTCESDESECYRKLLIKYEDLKMICRVRHTKIRELEDALSKGKENANNDNISSLHNQHYRQKYEQIKKDLHLVQEKYEEAKVLCNKRYEQLKILSNQQSGNS